MAGGFHEVLGGDCTFVVRDTSPDLLAPIPAISVQAPSRFVSLFYFFKLPRLIRQHAWNTPDTIFFGQDSYLLVLLLVWRQLGGYPYKVASDWHQLFGDWRDRYIARRSDVLITTSRRLQEGLRVRTGVAKEKTATAYGGVHTALFTEKRARSRAELRRSLGLPLAAVLVGYIGSFVSVAGAKGLETLVEALTHLPPEYTVVLAGDRRNQAEALRTLARKLGVAERCVILPWLPYEKLVACEVAMDVLVIPYPDTPHYRDYGFPMKVWEYMAAGRPIVYSKLPIIEEVLTGRGLPFVPGDSQSLAAAVCAARDPAQEARAAKNTLEVEEYTWAARARCIWEVVRGRVH